MTYFWRDDHEINHKANRTLSWFNWNHMLFKLHAEKRWNIMTTFWILQPFEIHIKNTNELNSLSCYQMVRMFVIAPDMPVVTLLCMVCISYSTLLSITPTVNVIGARSFQWTWMDTEKYIMRVKNSKRRRLLSIETIILSRKQILCTRKTCIHTSSFIIDGILWISFSPSRTNTW